MPHRLPHAGIPGWDLGLLNPGEAHEDLASPEDRDYMTVGIKEDFLQELLRDVGGK